MSHRSSTLTRLAAARALPTALSTALSRLRKQIVRHRDLVLVVGFIALVLTIKFTAVLTHADATTAPAPAVSAPAATVPGTAGQPGQQAPRQQAQQPAQPPAERSYQVRAGDTLARIALRHGVDYQRIASDNRLADPNLIRPGQTLRIGAPTPGVRLIQPGDTLTGLATTTGLTVRELRVLNPWITYPDRIPAGAGLRVRR